jgi:two-component system response regulator PhoP
MDHPEPAAQRGRRILIVDDDAGIRQTMAANLGNVGYRTHCAEDGEAGWSALRLGGFDALITDHDMPRLTGLDLIRRARAAALHLPIILMSGRMPWNETSLFRLLRPGIALRKPFTFDELVAKLRCILIPTALGSHLAPVPEPRANSTFRAP